MNDKRYVLVDMETLCRAIACEGKEEIESALDERAKLESELSAAREQIDRMRVVIKNQSIHLINEMGYPDSSCDPKHPDVELVRFAIAVGLIPNELAEEL